MMSWLCIFEHETQALLQFHCMFMQLTKLHCLNPIQAVGINLVKLPFHFSAIYYLMKAYYWIDLRMCNSMKS